MPGKTKVRPPHAERILQLRKGQLRLDQEEFAKRLDVDQGTVSKWETGKATPGPHTYMLLANLATGDLRRQLLADGRVGSMQKTSPAGDVVARAPGAELDRDLLSYVIEVIDVELSKKGLKLPSKKYAEAVILSYEFCHRTGQRDSDMVVRLLKLA